MSKLSVVKFRMPVMWVATIAVLTVAIAGGGVMFLATRAQDAHALNLDANKSQAPAMTAEQRGRVRASLDALPLAFEANQGQADPQVKYTARGNGYSVFLTGSDAVFAISSAKHPPEQQSRTGHAHSLPRTTEKVESAAIDMRLVGGNLKPEVVAGNELPGVTNYYVGSDSKNWHTGVKQYSAVSYRDVYPGVNMVFHGAQRQLEFDFVVSPGADPKTIGLGFKGAKRLATDAAGNLVLASSAGDVVLHKPVAYQEKDGKREIVEAAFLVKNRNEVGMNLGAYDRGRELVIDPTLSYATYLGGSAEDEIFGIAVDGSGNMYVAGQMDSPTFPSSTGTVSNVGNFDAFVTKISASGTSVGFTTLIAISGTGIDSALGVAVSGSNAYVVGNTSSAVFPSTVTLGPGGGQDAFVASLNGTSGAANYVTRIGGTGSESGLAIAVDSSGNAYIGGETDSTDFPAPSGIYTSTTGTPDGFVAKLNPAGSALVFSTYLGGSNADVVTGIALDGSNNVYVGGITSSTDFPTTSGVLQTTAKGGGDSFVTEIKADGSALVYSTYLGGTGSDQVLGIAVNATTGEAYVSGNTNSSDFPTANAAQTSNMGGDDVFVSKLNATGTGLVFSTYYGGTLDEVGTSIALDPLADAYVTGRTSSSDFPVSGSPFQGTLNGSNSDAFITEFSNTGSVVYSSFFGGTGVENSIAGDPSQGAIGAVAVDSSSNAYMAGGTASTTGFTATSPLPCCTSYAGGLSDGFVAKVGAAPADFSVAVSPSSISTTSGQTTSTITVTVSSVNSSYGQAVTLSCGGLPAKGVCHFSPASVTPGASPQTSSLTIATNGASSASLAMPGSHGTQVLAAMVLPIFGFTLLGTGMNPRNKKRLVGLLLLGLVLAGLMVLPACGGSGGGGGGGGGGGTPPGTYSMTVIGAAGSANHSAALTLTVN